jgi:hypothetical protein
MTSTDYVVQGNKVFFLADGITAYPLSGKCQCGDAKCHHLAIACRAINTPDSAHWTNKNLEVLAAYLKGQTISLYDGVVKFLRLDPLSKPRIEDMLDVDSEERLEEIVGWCERCETWMDIDDMSEDVEGVCLDCVR